MLQVPSADFSAVFGCPCTGGRGEAGRPFVALGRGRIVVCRARRLTTSSKSSVLRPLLQEARGGAGVGRGRAGCIRGSTARRVPAGAPRLRGAARARAAQAVARACAACMRARAVEMPISSTFSAAVGATELLRGWNVAQKLARLALSNVAERGIVSRGLALAVGPSQCLGNCDCVL